MTLLWIAVGLLTLLTVLLLVQPLLRARPPARPREAYDAAVLTDQLAEVDRDEAAGLVDAEAAAAARRELKRRLLGAMERAQPADAATSAVASPRRGRALALALAVGVPLVAVLAYLQLGNPSLPDEPLFARRTTGDLAQANQAAAGDPTLTNTVAQLERYLVDHPGEAQGWFMLGRAYLSLDRLNDAVAALARAKSLLPERPEVASAYGEALVLAADGRVTDEARAAFNEAFARDPRDVQARYYLALDRAQQGDVRGALQGWVDLVALSPRDAPWLDLVGQRIGSAAKSLGVELSTLRPSAEALALAPPKADAKATAEEAPAAAPGPGAEEMKAAAEMTPEQRQAMIRSMVERLASRLEQNPDDRNGWLRLARAYDVLGEPQKAAEARARADAASK